MAGTFQTLFFRPPCPGIVALHRRKPSIPVNYNLLSGSSANSNLDTSILLTPLSVLRPIRATDKSHQIDDNENPSCRISLSSWSKPLLNFAANNFLPLALVSGVAVGLANPSLGCLADKYYLSKFSTFGIFFISGLMLRSEEIGAAAEAWPVGIFGLV